MECRNMQKRWKSKQKIVHSQNLCDQLSSEQDQVICTKMLWTC